MKHTRKPRLLWRDSRARIWWDSPSAWTDVFFRVHPKAREREMAEDTAGVPARGIADGSSAVRIFSQEIPLAMRAWRNSAGVELVVYI